LKMGAGSRMVIGAFLVGFLMHLSRDKW